MKHGSFLLVTVLVLSGCAPALLGGTMHTPIEVTPGQTVEVRKPGLVFVQSGFTVVRLLLGQRNDEFTSVLSNDDIQPGKKVSSVVNWLLVRNATAPSGWTVELVKQVVTREVVSVTQAGNWRYYSAIDWVEPVLAINVPAGMPDGTYPVSVVLESKFDLTNPPPVQVNIKLTSAPAQ